MIYREINPHEFDAAMNIGWYSGSIEYYETKDMQGLYPDLFVGCYDDDKLIGICYGWPNYVHRWNKLVMGLRLIAIQPEYRNQGLGSLLLKTWEDRVRRRGDWLISLGSGADMFYVKNGYYAVEYCIKIHRNNFKKEFEQLPDLSHIKHGEYPMIVLYIKTGGNYDANSYNDLCTLSGSQDSFTVFIKHPENYS